MRLQHFQAIDALFLVKLKCRSKNRNRTGITVNTNMDALKSPPIVEIANEYQSFTTGTEKRRCGLQFGELTEEQAAQLESFLVNHTRGTT